MGDISDYYRDQELNKHLNHSFEDEYPDEDMFIDYNVWTTKAGNKIPVKLMKDSHVVNTINMINRNANESTEQWFDTFAAELRSRDIIPPPKSKWFNCDATEIDIY